MSSPETSTTSLRTYRFLRLSLVAVVLLLGVALAQYLLAPGRSLDSISASFYTPVRNVFVGSLVAAGLALLALSGHSWRQLMLNLAGLAAPVIAFVPTPIAAGSVPAFPTLDCGTAARCVPAEFEPDVLTGVTALLVVGLVGLVLTIVFADWTPDARRRSIVAIAATSALLVLVAVTLYFFNPVFLALAHYSATGVFFGLIAVVAVISGIVSRRDGASPFYVVAYVITAIGMAAGILVLLATFVPGIRDLAFPFMLVGEVIALAFFGAFWILQTIQKWRDQDAAFLR